MKRYWIMILGCLFTSMNAFGDSPLTIDVWYGKSQRFGHVGHPQRWINVLGEVKPVESLSSLEYRLNGANPLPLSFREDKKRIAKDGDFNIELDRKLLREGDNEIQIIATGHDDSMTQSVVHLNYVRESRWPLPYRIRWAEVSDIQQVAQVVDGKWKQTKDGVRSVERYYDRVIAFGDESWTDYCVTTRVTIHALTGPREGPNSTGVTHAAIALRWPGHDADGKQPSVKWFPLGATAEFRLGSNLKNCRWRIFDGKRQFYKESKKRRPLEFETPYRMKHEVQSLPDGRTRYRAKLWRDGEPEPTPWDLERYESGDLASGSALLIAHHSDVTFGDVLVERIASASDGEEESEEPRSPVPASQP